MPFFPRLIQKCREHEIERIWDKNLRFVNSVQLSIRAVSQSSERFGNSNRIVLIYANFCSIMKGDCHINSTVLNGEDGFLAEAGSFVNMNFAFSPLPEVSGRGWRWGRMYPTELRNHHHLSFVYFPFVESRHV